MTVFACPKPPKRLKKARKPLPRSTKPIARSGRPKPNPKRKVASFSRQYGSLERVLLIKSLPCAACGVVGFSSNAHLLGNDGGSRKGPYTEVGPLCESRGEVVGCHPMYDEHQGEFAARFPAFNPAEVAEETERAWLASRRPDSPSREPKI